MNCLFKGPRQEPPAKGVTVHSGPRACSGAPSRGRRARRRRAERRTPPRCVSISLSAEVRSKIPCPNSPCSYRRCGGALVQAWFMHRSCICGEKASWTLGPRTTAQRSYQSLWTMDRRKTGFASGCLLCPIPFLIHTSFILSVAVHDLTGRIFRVKKGGGA